MIDLSELINNWSLLVEAKYDFIYNEDEINMDEYLDNVRQTYEAVNAVYREIENDLKSVNAYEIMTYFNLLEVISNYAAPCYVDESNNHTFAVSRLIAEELAGLAANYLYYKEDEEEPFEEGILSSYAGFECEIERVLYYDVNKKDISDFQELADAIGY